MCSQGNALGGGILPPQVSILPVAQSLCPEKHAEVEQMLREVRAVEKRVLAEQDPDTRESGSSLAESLCRQAPYAEAEQMQHEVRAVRGFVLEEERETLFSMM